MYKTSTANTTNTTNTTQQTEQKKKHLGYWKHPKNLWELSPSLRFRIPKSFFATKSYQLLDPLGKVS
jgi:hypothetical protein